MEERDDAPAGFILTEEARVAPDGGFDRQRVLQQAFTLRVLRQQRPGVVACQLHMFRHTVISSAFVKSMKNAPTMGTTR